jgi:hypothetical protein
MTTTPLTRQPVTRRLRHASLNDLAAVLQTQQRQTVDLLVPASQVTVNKGLLEIAATDPILRKDGVLDPNGAYRLTSNADAQLAEKFGIPVKYIRRLHDEFVDLYDTNVNEWANHPSYADKKFLVRMLWGENPNDPEVTGVVRAIMSNRYAATDNFATLVAVLDGIREAGLAADSLHIQGDLTDDRLYVVVDAPEIQGYGWKLLEGYRSPYANTSHGGDDAVNLPIISAGLLITNSETGNGKNKITPRLKVRACGNGLTCTKDAVSSIHLGGELKEGVVEWSDETRQAHIELAKQQAKDAVKAFLNATYVQKVIDELEADASTPVNDIPKTIEVVSTAMGYTEDDATSIMNFFMDGGQRTAGGILQAVTAHVQTIDDPDRAYTIEEGAIEAMKVAVTANVVAV